LAQDTIKEIHKIGEERYFQELTAKVDNMPLDEDFSKQAMAAYNQFLEAYPNGVYSQNAQQRISKIPELIDDFDYEKLKAISSAGIDVKVAACNQYLENHPNGKHGADVKKLISDMSEMFYDDLKKEIADCDARGKWEKCIELSSFFISSFPNHRRWDEIVVVKNEMQAKIDLALLAEKVKQKGADYEAAKQLYLTYLKEHPKSPEKHKIMDELEKLDSQIKAKRVSKKVSVSKQLKTEKQSVTKGSEEDAKKISSIRIDKERIQREREKMRAKLKPLGRYVAHGDGTFTDSVTGLMWSILDSHLELGECLDYEDATQYVKSVTAGGYRDWRVPTSSDLAGIYKNKPFFPDSGASWYWTSKIYVDGHHTRAGIVTTEKETVFKREYADVDQCGAVRAVRP
jgi:tetratricopeptide (TPR) repeat protein